MTKPSTTTQETRELKPRLPMPTTEESVAWAEEAQTIADTLRELSDRFNGVDNGYCTICHQHRLYNTRGKVGPCENADCLSHRVSEILDAYDKPSERALEQIRQRCLERLGRIAAMRGECFCGTELEAGLCPNGHDPIATRVSDTEQRLREALAQAAIPYEALLMDAESRRWIAPRVWSAIETTVAAARAALQPEQEQK
jgi:hypothetical protein